jgi:hypothetical protein
MYTKENFGTVRAIGYVIAVIVIIVLVLSRVLPRVH